jgi:hypothetical protein
VPGVTGLKRLDEMKKGLTAFAVFFRFLTKKEIDSLREMVNLRLPN